MSSFVSPAPVTPAKIHADRPSRVLQIEWRDGHRTDYGFDDLRWLCPCALCRGEGGMPGWLDSNPTLTPAQTTMIDVRLVGSYAIQPTWGDGHATGFYGFANLRGSCPCGECTARRQSLEPAPEPAGSHREHSQHQGGDR